MQISHANRALAGEMKLRSDSLNSIPGMTIVPVSIVLLFVLTCCSSFGDPVDKDPISLFGRWEGYVGYGSYPSQIKGDLTLIVHDDRSCTVEGALSGNILAWGDFELKFEGTLHVDIATTALGEITVTRIRTGADTIQIAVTMSGQFDLKQAYVTGSWESNIDAAFGAAGDWGAMKPEDYTIVR